MNPQEIVPVNIKRIRISRGMNQSQTAAAAKISRQAYADIEKGKTREPKVSNLQSIADAFDVPLISLFEEPPKLETVRFRSNSIKTQKDKANKELCLIETAYWLKNFNFLQSAVSDIKPYQLKNLQPKIEKFDVDRPKRAAELVRKTLGLKEDEPIGDILGLVESAGIKVKTQNFDIKNFFGFSIAEADGGPAIVVNSAPSITIERQIFTVTHELGHLILHPGDYSKDCIGEGKKEEIEADRFAGYFLMPQRAFEKKLHESYGLGFVERVLHLKRFFGVSYSSVIHRMSDMGLGEYGKLLPKFIYLYNKGNKEKINSRKEPVPLVKLDFVEDYYPSLVRRALDKSQITVSRAAEMLNVSLENMRATINSWADIPS
ncbi:Helix-turn-helix domain protein [Limihaloglobus sulfuriphilus]|uniref:Helix-turn-helix domain protein n=1 Tax=Limihaloglobus sulfuriphilus TaxID=1851148 RepID=A0A1Q2MGN8_9BACT|nr:XRE family transcriptional regulator [Limihaloglobus sulfuriphilus]AQQ71698.1 Helix-turn-helix domain protein [Limihaloglobus sulfuriphilus]